MLAGDIFTVGAKGAAELVCDAAEQVDASTPEASSPVTSQRSSGSEAADDAGAVISVEQTAAGSEQSLLKIRDSLKNAMKLPSRRTGVVRVQRTAALEAAKNANVQPPSRCFGLYVRFGVAVDPMLRNFLAGVVELRDVLLVMDQQQPQPTKLRLEFSGASIQGQKVFVEATQSTALSFPPCRLPVWSAERLQQKKVRIELMGFAPPANSFVGFLGTITGTSQRLATSRLHFAPLWEGEVRKSVKLQLPLYAAEQLSASASVLDEPAVYGHLHIGEMVLHSDDKSSLIDFSE